MFVNLPCIILCFANVVSLVLCGTESALLVYVIIMPSSHNIATFLCCCNIDLLITKVTMMRYDCKHVLHIIVKTLSTVGAYNP